MSESQSLSAREARVRRALAREGHALRKSRRDGTYMVVDPITTPSLPTTSAPKTGQITVQGGGLDRNLPHAPPPSNADVFAVTGGTGIYAGANGTLTISHGRHADFFTVALR